ncbi:MAG: SPOR domain-containing protein [Pseudomonadota bacterium]
MKTVRNQTKLSVLLVVSVFVLAGCVDGPILGNSKPENPAATKATGKAAEVAAPEVFSRTDRAVWDGRPTLGGLWIAHPNANTPARATITNVASGKSTTGALWSKTPGIPGPPFTVSSDLAVALGMQAGTPVEIRVVALKKVVEATPEAESDAKSEELPEVAATEETSGNSAATAKTEAVEETPKRQPFRLFGTRKEKNAEQVATPQEDKTVEAAPALSGSGRAAQVGLFSDKANADRVAATLSQKGLGAKIISGKSNAGKSFWRVVTGPAKDTSAEAKLLADVKALGFPDAFLIKE